jgi:hypothetical protein
MELAALEQRLKMAESKTIGCLLRSSLSSTREMLISMIKLFGANARTLDWQRVLTILLALKIGLPIVVPLLCSRLEIWRALLGHTISRQSVERKKQLRNLLDRLLGVLALRIVSSAPTVSLAPSEAQPGVLT